MPSKRVNVTLRSVSRRRSGRRPSRRNRRPIRRRKYTSRRSRRYASSSRRKTGNFAQRVLGVTSTTQQVTVDNTYILQSNPGLSSVYTINPTMAQTLHTSIQGLLNSDTVAAAAGTKNYFLKRCSDTITFTNFSAAKVHIKFYFYRVRRDINQNASTLYSNGFVQDGNISATAAIATPYMSSDFCSACSITRVVSRTLEQGQSYKCSTVITNQRVNRDRRTNNLLIQGSRGVLAIAVGSLGIDNTTKIVTTGPTAVAARVQSVASYMQLADNTINNTALNTLPTSAANNFKFANSDTGVAAVGQSGDII